MEIVIPAPFFPQAGCIALPLYIAGDAGAVGKWGLVFEIIHTSALQVGSDFDTQPNMKLDPG